MSELSVTARNNLWELHSDIDGLPLSEFFFVHNDLNSTEGCKKNIEALICIPHPDSRNGLRLHAEER